MTGLNYPDNLYADHEERKARRSQEPTGAYRSAPEMPEPERKLRTALAYVNHARDLIREALDQPTGGTRPNQPTGCAPERVPKWDPAWGKQPPNCGGQHPMQAETIRQADEFGRDHDASGV